MVLASIRKISGKKKLKNLKKKNASPVPFNKIKTVGIIYYLKDESELKNLIKIQKNSFFNNKDVQIICWLKTTKKKKHPHIEGIVFVDRTDFDVNFLSGSIKTSHFCDQKFDLLIDLTSAYYFPMHALAVMSNAKLKTGMDHKPNWHLHVKMKLGDSKNNSIFYLFDQILKYLEKLF